MRPKVVIAALAPLVVLMAALVFMKQPPADPPPDVAPPVAEAAEESAPAAPLPMAVVPIIATNDAARRAQVQQRIKELSWLSMKSDEESRESIMADLRHPDPEIRAAALDAIIQFDDRSVIPRLEELAAQTEDAVEKKKLQEAAEYIKLPSLTEYMAQQKARRAELEARGITNLPTRKRTVVKRGASTGLSLRRSPNETSDQAPAEGAATTETSTQSSP